MPRRQRTIRATLTPRAQSASVLGVRLQRVGRRIRGGRRASAGRSQGPSPSPHPSSSPHPIGRGGPKPGGRLGPRSRVSRGMARGQRRKVVPGPMPVVLASVRARPMTPRRGNVRARESGGPTASGAPTTGAPTASGPTASGARMTRAVPDDVLARRRRPRTSVVARRVVRVLRGGGLKGVPMQVAGKAVGGNHPHVVQSQGVAWPRAMPGQRVRLCR